MQHFFRIITAVIALIALPMALAAQWKQTSGPTGGEPVSFVHSGEYIFAGTVRGGVYRSSNNGENWQQFGLDGVSVYTLTALKGRIIAGSNKGVYFTSTTSISWKPALENYAVRALLIVDTIAIAGTENDGIFRSTDGGQTWAKTDAPAGNVFSLGRRDSIMFAGTLIDGMFRSFDMGATWQQITDNVPPNIYSIITIENTIIAGTITGLHTSSDNGTTWKQLALDSIIVYAITAPNGTTLTAATSNGVYISTDLGATWQISSAAGTDTRAIYRKEAMLFGGLSYDGIMRSDDGGKSWNIKNTGFVNTTILSLLADSVAVFSGVDERGVAITTDNGISWQQTSMDSMDVYALGGNNAYTIAGTRRNGVFITTDKGAVWRYIGLFGYSANTIVKDGNDIHVGLRNSGLVFTTNEGATWTTSISGTDIQSLYFTQSEAYVCFNSGIYISPNKGRNWYRIQARPTLLGYFSIISDGHHIITGTEQGIYRSGDKGNTWKQAEIPDIAGYKLVRDGSNVFAATNRGVYLSTDRGDTWADISEGCPYKDIRSIALSGNYVYIGTIGGGVWRRGLDEFPNSAEEGGKPNNPAALVNYPNPVASVSTMTFSVRAAGHTTLKIYDALGKEIAVLFSGDLLAGTHQVVVDAGNLPAGTYHCRLQSGVQTEAIILTVAR